MYCKYGKRKKRKGIKIVLIVAKCIVNVVVDLGGKKVVKVLIVAKCIVNLATPESLSTFVGGINSSKVYCK